MKRQVLFSLALVSALTASAQRIDFNLTGRSESQVNEPEYTAWAVNSRFSPFRCLYYQGIEGWQGNQFEENLHTIRQSAP